MKACTKCGDTKPLDQFHKNKLAVDGKRCACKKCISAEALARYHNNRDEYNEACRLRRLAKRDEINAVKRIWRTEKSRMERCQSGSDTGAR